MTTHHEPGIATHFRHLLLEDLPAPPFHLQPGDSQNMGPSCEFAPMQVVIVTVRMDIGVTVRMDIMVVTVRMDIVVVIVRMDIVVVRV